MRSSGYPPLSFYPHKLLGLCFLTFSIAPLSHILTYPYFLKALSNSAIILFVFSSTSQLSLLIVFILFLVIVVIICYIGKFLLFFTFINSQQQLGDLSTSLEMTVHSQLFFLQGRTTFPGDSSGFSNPLNDRAVLEIIDLC